MNKGQCIVKTHAGFTLVELLATIAVATILLGIATPSFIEFSRKTRITTYTNDFVATMNFARSEAIRRGATVTICHTNNETACSGTWSDGWLVFTDKNGNGAIDTTDNDEILRTHEHFASGYALGTNDTFANNIIYGPDGAANDIGVFAVCHGTETKGARAIIVTRLRPRTATDTDGDGIPNKDTGNIASCTDP